MCVRCVCVRACMRATAHMWPSAKTCESFLLPPCQTKGLNLDLTGLSE